MNDEGYLIQFDENNRYHWYISLDENIKQIAISNKYIFTLNKDGTEINCVNNPYGYGKFSKIFSECRIY